MKLSTVQLLALVAWLALPALRSEAAPFAFIAGGPTLTVIDTRTHTVVAERPMGSFVNSIHVLPGASRAYASGSRLRVIDTRALGEIASWESAIIERFAVSPSAPLIYATLDQPFGAPIVRVQVISTESGAVTKSFDLAGGAIGDVAFNASGSLVLIANFWGYVHVIEAASGTELGRIPITGFPEAIAVHPRLDRAYLPQLGAGTVSVADLQTRTITAVIPVGSSPRFAVVNPAGTRVFVSHYLASGHLSVIDTGNNQVIATIPACAFPDSMDITPDGESVYVICRDSVEIISTSALARVNSIRVASPQPLGKGHFIGGPDDTAPTMPDVLTGLWWQPAEPGWGLHLTQRRSTVFAVLFTYDARGAPRWYVAPECRPNVPLPCPTCVQDAICNGKVYEMSGPAFFTGFNPATVGAREAGIAELRFANADQGIVTMVIDGAHRSVAIRRQAIRAQAVSGTNFTDLWWNPLESGWGLGLTHQGNTMFLTWFVYDDFGRAVWYVASDCQVKAAGNGCAGTLYRASGPVGPLPASFESGALRVNAVGTVDLHFSGPSDGTLSYSVDGRSAARPLTRQLF